MSRHELSQHTPNLLADLNDQTRLARTPGTEYTPNGSNLTFKNTAKKILNHVHTNKYKQRTNYYNNSIYPSQPKQTKSQMHKSVGNGGLQAINLIQSPELQPAVKFVEWLKNRTASQLTCIKPKILDVIKPCISGYNCERCDDCENCKESKGINIRSTIESSAITTQLNQIVKGKFKDRTDLCCWLCGVVIPFGNCEIEHVYSSTVTAITSMQYFLAYSNNEQVSNDVIQNIICNKRTHPDKKYDIRYNSLYPAHKLCNRCKAGDVFTDFDYDAETKNFNLKPNIVEITAFAERYAKYIYEGQQQPFTAQGGESAPVYLGSDMLRGNDLALIEHFKTIERAAFKQNIINNITRIMDYSSEFNISEQTLIQNVTSMQQYYPIYYKSKNNIYMLRETLFSVSVLKDFIPVSFNVYSFAGMLEAEKIITIKQRKDRAIQLSDLCTYKYVGISDFRPYLEDDINELLHTLTAKGIRKNKSTKTKKNKNNKTRRNNKPKSQRNKLKSKKQKRI